MPHSERTAFQEPAFSGTETEEASRQHAANSACALRMAPERSPAYLPDRRQGETCEGRVIVAGPEVDDEAVIVIDPLADAASDRGPASWALIGTDGSS
jgi:hypothetical protein